MKIDRTYDFYCSLLEKRRYIGNLDAILGLNSWHWVSQEVASNSLFLAFKGKRRDAFGFVEEVLLKGAQVIVASCEHEKKIQQLTAKFPYALFILEDPLIFLLAAAKKLLKSMSNLVRIGITGSNGKTSTKEILASVLANSSYSYFASQGNYNSLIGVCLSVLQMKGEEEIAVFEMGINCSGDMDELVELLKPQITIITNFSQAHLGPLGSMNALVEEKVKITRYAQVVFCSKSCISWLSCTDFPKLKLIVYATEKEFIRLSSELNKQRFIWQGQVYSLNLPGEGSLLAARCVLELAKYLNIPTSSLKKGFSEVSLPPGRMQLIKTTKGICFLNDAYNANPNSLEILLKLLKENVSQLSVFSRTFFIFSGFKELGDHANKAHRCALESILSLPFNGIFLLGEDLEGLAKAFKVTYFSSVEHSLEYFQYFFISNDFIVLKGARYYSLERIIKLFDKE